MMKVKEYMTRKPIFATLPGNREDALGLMVKNNKTSLPVVSGDEEYLGVITRKMIFNNPSEEQLAMLVDREHPFISPTADIDKAADMMLSSRVFRLPVVKGGKLVGIITPTDLLSIVENQGLTDPVEDYISSTCVPIHVKTPLNVALNIIRVTAVYALPVLDDDSRLVGIITDRDLFNMSYIDEGMALTELGLGGDEDEWTWEGLRSVMSFYFETSKVDLPRTPVEEVMIREPHTVFRKTAVSKAARDMRKNDFGQLPVLDNDNRLDSIVYDLDIIGALFKGGE